jgi:hypothetical protein
MGRGAGGMGARSRGRGVWGEWERFSKLKGIIAEGPFLM